MRVLRAILDRAILLGAVLMAGCVPSFIVQFRQRAGGRLDQVLLDLTPFQSIANRNFGGSLPALIRYHLGSQDATFHQEGVALQGMLDTAARLRAMLQALDTDLPHQCLYLLSHPDWGLLRATWGGYQPGFTFTAQSMLFALTVGVLAWVLLVGGWLATAKLGRWLFSPPVSARAAVRAAR